MRRRGGLNRVGLLAIALLIALGAVGVTYSAWTDEIYIAGTFNTSGINTTLDCGTAWETVDGTIINIPDTSIACNENGQLEIKITVNNALAFNNPNDLLDVDYYCGFILDNTAAGSLPVKVDSFTITPSGTYPDVSAVVENLPVGTVLDPGTINNSGRVHIFLTSVASENLTLEFTLTANMVRWNQ